MSECYFCNSPYCDYGECEVQVDIDWDSPPINKSKLELELLE